MRCAALRPATAPATRRCRMTSSSAPVWNRDGGSARSRARSALHESFGAALKGVAPGVDEGCCGVSAKAKDEALGRRHDREARRFRFSSQGERLGLPSTTGTARCSSRRTRVSSPQCVTREGWLDCTRHPCTSPVLLLCTAPPFSRTALFCSRYQLEWIAW